VSAAETAGEPPRLLLLLLVAGVGEEDVVDSSLNMPHVSRSNSTKRLPCLHEAEACRLHRFASSANLQCAATVRLSQPPEVHSEGGHRGNAIIAFEACSLQPSATLQ